MSEVKLSAESVEKLAEAIASKLLQGIEVAVLEENPGPVGRILQAHLAEIQKREAKEKKLQDQMRRSFALETKRGPSAEELAEMKAEREKNRDVRCPDCGVFNKSGATQCWNCRRSLTEAVHA
jgi:hypothetical protein